MAVLASGAKLTAAGANQIPNNSIQVLDAKQSTASLSYGSSIDVTGATKTFTTAYANTKFEVKATFDVTLGTGTPTFIGTVIVDGVTYVNEAHLSGAQFTRGTVVVIVQDVFVSAGSHTIKLHGSGGAQCSTSANHTNFTATVYGPA